MWTILLAALTLADDCDQSLNANDYINEDCNFVGFCFQGTCYCCDASQGINNYCDGLVPGVWTGDNCNQATFFATMTWGYLLQGDEVTCVNDNVSPSSPDLVNQTIHILKDTYEGEMWGLPCIVCTPDAPCDQFENSGTFDSGIITSLKTEINTYYDMGCSVGNTVTDTIRPCNANFDNGATGFLKIFEALDVENDFSSLINNLTSIITSNGENGLNWSATTLNAVFYSHVEILFQTILTTRLPTPAPTPEPTRLPTPAPTPEPSTFEPTVPSTLAPTFSAASIATESPTTVLTFSPTILPTLTLTDSPTTVPTFSPTNTPTNSPTITITSLPSTISPSSMPTESPISDPTSFPTIAPTTSPSFLPTETPIASPTSSPTTAATLVPTTSPTLVPTLVPTMSPTYLATDQPTYNLTLKPFTSAPSKIPTEAAPVTLDDEVFNLMGHSVKPTEVVLLLCGLTAVLILFILFYVFNQSKKKKLRDLLKKNWDAGQGDDEMNIHEVHIWNDHIVIPQENIRDQYFKINFFR